MIKYTMHGDRSLIVGLGLSRGNMKKLMEGKPILVNLQDLGVTDPIEIFIHFGETEQALKDEVIGIFGVLKLIYGFDEKENQS